MSVMLTTSARGSTRWGISAERSTALSTSYASMTLNADTVGDTGAKVVPSSCYLSDVVLQLTTIAGGATSVTWFVSQDLAGDKPLTLSCTSTIVTGKTTAASGSVTMYLGKDYVKGSDGVTGELFLQVKLNAGTANGVARLTWRETL